MPQWVNVRGTVIAIIAGDATLELWSAVLIM
jgi:hypothetical protein